MEEDFFNGVNQTRDHCEEIGARVKDEYNDARKPYRAAAEESRESRRAASGEGGGAGAG